MLLADLPVCSVDNKIRLASIDAPELDHPYDLEAAQLLRSLGQTKHVIVSIEGVDKYNREAGKVYYDSYHNASDIMLLQGAVWHLSYFGRTDKNYIYHKP